MIEHVGHGVPKEPFAQPWSEWFFKPIGDRIVDLRSTLQATVLVPGMPQAVLTSGHGVGTILDATREDGSA